MFKVLLFNPIFNLMVGFYKLFGNNLGFAIIALAIFSRLVTIPFLVNQLKSTEKMSALKPRLEKIKTKYKDNKEKQNEEQLKLYKEMGINPLSGCLPLVVQLIFLVQVRSVVVALVEQGISSFNDIAYFSFLKFPADYQINLNFFGLDLNKVAADFSFSDPHIIPYVILAVLVGLTQLFSTKMLTPAMPTASDENKEGKKDEKKDDTAASIEKMTGQMNKQMMYFFPIMTIFMALGYTGSSYFSASLSIFWTVQNLFVIIQRLFVSPEARKTFFEKISKITSFFKKKSVSK